MTKEITSIPVHLQIDIKRPATMYCEIITKKETIEITETYDVRSGFKIKTIELDVEIEKDFNKEVTTFSYYKIDADRSDPESILYRTTEEVVIEEV